MEERDCSGEPGPLCVVVVRKLVNDSGLAPEGVANLVRDILERLLSNVVESIFVQAGSVEPADFLENLLVIVGRRECRDFSEPSRGILGEDLLEDAPVLLGEGFEIAKASFVRWDGVRLEPPTI